MSVMVQLTIKPDKQKALRELVGAHNGVSSVYYNGKHYVADVEFARTADYEAFRFQWDQQNKAIKQTVESGFMRFLNRFMRIR